MSKFRAPRVAYGMILIALTCAGQRGLASGAPLQREAGLVRGSRESDSPDLRWQGRSLGQAHLGKRMMERILHDLVGDPPRLFLESIMKYTMVLPFMVGEPDEPRHLIRVWGGGESCGATGVCTMLIYDVHSGQRLLDDEGWDFQFLRTSHHGAQDVLVRGKSSCCEMWRTLYRYDGQQYKLVKTTPGR